MSKQQLAIVDYITLEIHLFDVDTDRDIELSELGFRDSNCHYMWREGEIPVIHHKEVIK